MISDVGSTVGDSDDDAPLVCSQREALGVQQGMPITVGGRFASLVEVGDECEEFDMTIADDVEESSVEVRADTDVEVATTAVDRHNSPSASLLDALDHDVTMEDNGQVGSDVDNPADSESDIVSDLGDRAPVDPAPRNLQPSNHSRDQGWSLVTGRDRFGPHLQEKAVSHEVPSQFLERPIQIRDEVGVDRS